MNEWDKFLLYIFNLPYTSKLTNFFQLTHSASYQQLPYVPENYVSSKPHFLAVWSVWREKGDEWVHGFSLMVQEKWEAQKDVWSNLKFSWWKWADFSHQVKIFKTILTSTWKCDKRGETI